MKITKLVVGILQIILSLVILFQSCASGFVNSVENSNDHGGTAGLLVAIMYLATGIVYIATRKSEKLGGDIAGMVMMLIAGLFALTNAHVYQDLIIWGILSIFVGIGFFVWHLVINKKSTK